MHSRLLCFFFCLVVEATNGDCAVDGSCNNKAILIIGASGAIGKALTKKFLDNGISVIAGLRKSPLPPELSDHPLLKQEFGIDMTNGPSIEKLFIKYHGGIGSVWNLAAPLSVDTASNPNLAYDVVVNGMNRLLASMAMHKVPTILFSDSIGSFGHECPRNWGATATWLLENPKQDPGSDYGEQKRICRELMAEWVKQGEGREMRFAVIPGVLHDDSTWGGGTTEYALDAMKAARNQEAFTSPVPLNVQLPMIWRDDLISGLFKLTMTPYENLAERDGGYSMSGFSFSARELFDEIQKLLPKFSYEEGDMGGSAASFARLWPDALSGIEATRDLDFTSQETDLRKVVETLLRNGQKQTIEAIV